MELVRDCLDKQVDDRVKRRMGRVDGSFLCSSRIVRRAWRTSSWVWRR